MNLLGHDKTAKNHCERVTQHKLNGRENRPIRTYEDTGIIESSDILACKNDNFFETQFAHFFAVLLQAKPHPPRHSLKIEHSVINVIERLKLSRITTLQEHSEASQYNRRTQQQQ
jgi:hypothetical protein